MAEFKKGLFHLCLAPASGKVGARSKRSVRSVRRWAAIGAMISGWRIKQNK
jgi:hypothetical protein